MNKYLFLLISFFFFSSFAQKSEKPVYFYDVNGERITYSVFNDKKVINNKLEHLQLYFENDTCYIGRLVKRHNYGKLDANNLAKLKEFINKISKNSINDSENLIIQYYPGKDKCNGTNKLSGAYIYQKKYRKKLKKRFRHKMLWIYKNDENLKNHHLRKIDWKHDSSKIIEDLFFKQHYPCGSFVVISFDGNYISNYGEYGPDEISKLVNEIQKHNNSH